MGFSRSGSQISAYSAETNPRKCIALTQQGFGLRDRDLAKTFSTFIRRKISG